MIGRFTYGPYGQHYCQTGLPPLLGFNGQRYDPVALTYALGMGYRSYSPTLMRFQGPDDLSPFAEGGLNAYAYCLNDPVNLLDTTGHAPTAAQLQARMKQMGLKTASYASGIQHGANAPKRKDLLRPHSAPRDVKPKKTISFNETTENFFYKKEQLKSKRQLFQERKALISYMGREYRIFELYRGEFDELLTPSTEAMFKQLKSPHIQLALITVIQSQLDDIRERFRRFDKTLKSIRL